MKHNRKIALLLICIILANSLSACRSQPVHLDAFVGDGMMQPMLQIKEIYEAQNPQVCIDFFFAGSGTLEETIRSLKKGDLFMPGGTVYIENLTQDGLIVASYPVAYHLPAIVVRRDDTAVTTWDDLAKKGVQIAIPNPDLATSGVMAQEIISQSSQKEQIEANVTALTADVRESIRLLEDGETDATISWRSAATLIAPDKLMTIEIPQEINKVFEIWIAVPTYSTAQDEAIAFAEFVAGVQGQQVFKDMGFLIIEK